MDLTKYPALFQLSQGGEHDPWHLSNMPILRMSIHTQRGMVLKGAKEAEKNPISDAARHASSKPGLTIQALVIGF